MQYAQILIETKDYHMTTGPAGWTSMLEVKNMKTLKKILRYVKWFIGAIGCVDLQIEIDD